MTSSSTDWKHRLDLQIRYCTGVRSYLVGRKPYVRYNGRDNILTSDYEVRRSSRLRAWSSVFHPVYCMQMWFKSPESWGSSSTGMQTIFKFMITVSPVTHRSQLTNRLTHCIEVMGCWMSNNRPRLNASKTEFIWLGWTRRLARCTFDPIIINGDTILPSRTVRDLGAYIDSGINFDDHVARLTRTCFFQIRQLRSICRSLTVESSHALVTAP